MIKKIVLPLLAVFGLLIACSNKENDEKKDSSNTRVDGRAILENEDLDASQKAVELVNAGEMLFTPESFFLADPLFQVAISLDPKNQKAQMYQAMIKPLMNLKGIVKRIEPLMKADPIEYKNFRSSYYGENSFIKSHPLLDGFLKDGDEDISTEEELQDFIQTQIAAYNDARLFFKKHKNLKMEVNISEKWYEQRLANRGYKCTYKKVYDLTVDIDCQTDLDFMKVKVDRGEMEVLKNSYAGMQIYTILFTAYDAMGLQRAIIEERNIVDATQRDIVEVALASGSRLGTLRDNQALASILDLGIDGMAGLRWVKDNQESLCPLPVEGTSFVYDFGDTSSQGYVDPNGKYYPNVRIGKDHLRRDGYLFDEGLCLDNKTFNRPIDKVLNMIDLALSGGVIEVEGKQKRTQLLSAAPYKMDHKGRIVKNPENRLTVVETGKIVKAEVQPAIILTQPIQDLRSLVPNDYNECGNIKSFSDNTLGGLFPNGDAHDYFSEINEINQIEDKCAEK